MFIGSLCGPETECPRSASRHSKPVSPKDMRSPHRRSASRRPPPLPSAYLLFFLLLALPPRQAAALWPSSLLQWPTLVSLSHSLLTRVANLRAERGDLAGAARAHAVAEKLRFLGPGGGVWSLGWDYAKHYAFRGGPGFGDLPTKDMWELLTELRELGRMRSDGDRARWAGKNYARVASMADSVLRGLVRSFSQSGPLREVMSILQREVAEGELVRDCLEVGAKDLEGLATIARDMFFSSSQSESQKSEL